MGKAKSEVGNQYGYLTVLERAGVDSSHHVTWKCQCICGNIIEVRGSKLRAGEKLSCGCQHTAGGFKDETGNRYGRLLVLGVDEDHKSKDRSIQWICQCDCGNIISVNGRSLRSGKQVSCGCYINEHRGETQIKDEVGNTYGNLTVLELVKTSKRCAHWLCQCTCGNKIVVRGADLRSGNTKSCGCIQSFGEQKIQQWLQKYNINYQKQYIFKDLISKKGGNLRFDFAIFKNQELQCLIEYQGIQHFQERNGDFGKDQREITDNMKKEYCKLHNIPLYEIRYDEDVEEKLSQIFTEEPE